MLIQEDEEISVKVLDLALPSRTAAGHESILRQDYEFSAPEEIAGKAVDVRSGVYSLGALLYYMLASAESYKLIRAKSLANEEVSLDDTVGLSPHVADHTKERSLSRSRKANRDVRGTPRCD